MPEDKRQETATMADNELKLKSPSRPTTATMAEDILKSLCASRRGKLGVCTRKMNEIKALLEHGGIAESVTEGVAGF